MKLVRVLPLLLLTCVTRPAQVFDPAKLREIDAAIESEIAAKKLPGGVLWIERDGATYHRAYGNRALTPSVEKMTEDTIFDAASITKVAATTPSIWILIERDKIGLDAKVSEYIPEFRGGWRDEITIRHLLTHTSGLRPDLDLDDPWSGYDTAMKLTMVEEPTNRPGITFRYSDINFLLLGEIVHRVSGMPLDEFARREIFEPLGMKDTGFLSVGPAPSPAVAVHRDAAEGGGATLSTRRIAPTEIVRPEGLLRGVVHDPTARRVGGVAGHAGLFTTAKDLARYARMLMNGGETILKPDTVKMLTSSLSPPNVAVRRAGGFDLDSGFSRPRGEHFPIGSFGHTGWTGGFFWIDPQSRTFYVFLSNRVHPDGKGSVLPLQKRLGTLVAEAVGITEKPKRRVDWVTGGADTMNGIDALHASKYRALQGLRIGLITNHTGIDRAGNPTIDLLRSAPGVQLVALFSPEHGIRGDLDDKFGDETDAASGLPIHSLYGESRKPTAAQLANLDALVFDIQDIGARFYTYIATLGLAMEAAAESKKKVFVLDRVNPIGGVAVEGSLPDGELEFISYHPITIRHGMTVGELARMFKDEKKLDVDLEVIQLRRWKREHYQDEAGLPWINTSPNMRSLTAATLYPGVGLVEYSISVGRGTDTPFELLGAPYVDGEVLARELNLLKLPGIRFEPAQFTPTTSHFEGLRCGGVRLILTDRKAFQAVRTGIAIAHTLQRLYSGQFAIGKMDKLLRSRAILTAIREGRPLDEVNALWREDERRFLERRGKYLLY